MTRPYTDEPLPPVGGRSVLLGADGEPLAALETTEVRVLRAGDVDFSFACDEGEGRDRGGLAPRAHEAFWADESIDDDTRSWPSASASSNARSATPPRRR
jgi:uncharacterized protein YhfF